VTLPQFIVDHDRDFLAVILTVVVGMCVLAFTAGWLLGRLFRVELPQRISLMFGLGMNNNGTGLVLATVALSRFPHVMLPIIFYNLVQHLVAGSVDFLLFRRDFSNGAESASDGSPLANASGSDLPFRADPSAPVPRAEG
jgi:BASS family bile acid:Na+ symporter